MDNEEIIEKYLHNNYGKETSEVALNEARADERAQVLAKAEHFNFKIKFGREIGDEEMAELSGWFNQVVEQHTKFIEGLEKKADKFEKKYPANGYKG